MAAVILVQACLMLVLPFLYSSSYLDTSIRHLCNGITCVHFPGCAAADSGRQYGTSCAQKICFCNICLFKILQKLKSSLSPPPRGKHPTHPYWQGDWSSPRSTIILMLQVGNTEAQSRLYLAHGLWQKQEQNTGLLRLGPVFSPQDLPSQGNRPLTGFSLLWLPVF